jgi:hypothetical protein
VVYKGAECRLSVLNFSCIKKSFSVALKFHFLALLLFGPKRDEVTGEWRRLHNKELYALYFSPNIIRVIKSRAEKTKYMVMSRDQNAGQNGYIQIGNESFETAEQFKYFGTTLTN